MKLFTTSKMGLNIKQTGAGPRDKQMQSNFRTEMIKLYACYDEKQERLLCPILSEWIIPKYMTARLQLDMVRKFLGVV
jgi:hypothetical protein